MREETSGYDRFILWYEGSGVDIIFAIRHDGSSLVYFPNFNIPVTLHIPATISFRLIGSVCDLLGGLELKPNFAGNNKSGRWKFHSRSVIQLGTPDRSPGSELTALMKPRDQPEFETLVRIVLNSTTPPGIFFCMYFKLRRCDYQNKRK